MLLDLFKSKGLKRKIAAALAAAAVIISYVPALQPYQPLLAEIAGYLGIAGYAHAAAAKSQ